MKKIALFIILVLALSLMLVSCGCEHVDANYDEVCDVCGEATPLTPEYLGFEGIYNTTYESDEEAALKAATKIDELKDMQYYATNKNLVVFTNDYAEAGETKLAIVNVDTAKVVYSLNKEVTTGDNATKVTKSAYARSFGEFALIVETATDSTDEYKVSYTTTVYSALGTSIASKTYKQQMSSVQSAGENMFIFDGKVYTVKDDVVAFKCDLGFKDIPDYTIATEKYYYDIIYDEAVYVYYTNFEYVTCYEAPKDVEDVNISVLADGNIMAQFVYELPEDATEYDLVYDKSVEEEYYPSGMGSSYYKHTVINDVKYDLVTIVYNVETKTATEYDVNYIFGNVINKTNGGEEFAETFVSEKIVNFAIAYEIIDKKIADNESYISIANNLKVIGYLGQEIPDQDGIAELVANNRFVVDDKAGNTYLLNEKGEVLADISGATRQGQLIMTRDGKLYDCDLNLKLDSATMDYQILDGEDDYAIFYNIYKEGEEVKYDYYLCDAATYTFKKLALTTEEVETLDLYSDYYVYTTTVKENEVDKTYRVYCNVEGTEIFRICTDTTTTTDAETGTVTKVYEYASVQYNFGSMFIKVTTTTIVGYEYTYTYNYYIVK